jgi:broad specificity phosphatase PhoE
MKYIIIARHTNNKITGNEGIKPTDGPITPKGEQQAAEMQQFLLKYNIDCIYSSLYLRANQTADIINSERAIKKIQTNAFNEYMMRENRKSVEDVDTAKSRSMSKIYSVLDSHECMLIVAHSSINQTMYQSLTNMTYEGSIKLYKNYGEIRVLRYDYTLGDNCWKEVDSFIPEQD